MKENVTAEEVKRAITGRISTGVYPAGGKLPSLRAMAQELGANRNTVNKAYRALEELGILEPEPGRKAFIVGQSPDAGGVAEQWRRQAHDVVWQAMAIGVPREQVECDLETIVDDVYGQDEVKLKFLECNAYDSRTMAAEIARIVGLPIEPGLLDEAPRIAADQSYDLIVTTFHHLAEVDQVFAHDMERVVGVDTRPSPEVMHQLARLGGKRIGIVCGAANTTRQLSHLIASFQPRAEIETALVDDPDAIAQLVAWSDHLVVTHSAVDDLKQQTTQEPDVIIDFLIDEQSVIILKRQIHALRTARTARPVAA